MQKDQALNADAVRSLAKKKRKRNHIYLYLTNTAYFYVSLMFIVFTINLKLHSAAHDTDKLNKTAIDENTDHQNPLENVVIKPAKKRS